MPPRNATTLASIALAATLLAACGGSPPDEPHPALAQDYRGLADGQGDRPDYDCRVTLRTAGRISTGPGYATTCDLGISDDGACRYVWQGRLATAADQPDLVGVEVLYRTNQTNGTWYSLPAEPTESDEPGFDAWSFTLADFTPAAGMSMSSLNQTVIELIPYAVSADGSRLFDHNRIADPLGAYRMTLDNLWSVEAAPGVCSPLPVDRATWVFSFPGWNAQVDGGPIAAGGQVEIAYDGRRLRETQACLGSQGPVSSTSLYAGWRFDGGPVQTARVEAYTESFGYACQGPEEPCISHTVDALVVDVPADATELEAWFYCVPGFSQGAEENWRYDSNLGQNYRAQVSPAANPIHWAGAWEHRASRSGFVFELPEPLTYAGFTNMGWAVQAQVYVHGLTDQHQVDDHLVKAYVESDVPTCDPGGALSVVELPLAAAHQGPFGNNSLYRWGYEGQINNCPHGTYRYRFLFSADGGQTFTALGAAASTDDPSADAFRSLIFQ